MGQAGGDRRAQLQENRGALKATGPRLRQNTTEPALRALNHLGGPFQVLDASRVGVTAPHGSRAVLGLTG